MTKTQELQSILDEIIKENPGILYSRIKYEFGHGWYVLKVNSPDVFFGENYQKAKSSLEELRTDLSRVWSGGAA